MPKLSQSPSLPRVEESRGSKIVHMSRMALFASALSMTPACTPQSSGSKAPAAAPTIVVPDVEPTTEEQPEIDPGPKPKSKPKAKVVEDCADKNVPVPEAENQVMDEQLASGKDSKVALSDFYKNPINAKLYAFSHDFAVSNNSQGLYLGLLECRPGYAGRVYLSHPDKLQVLKEMRDYCVSRYQSDPHILAAIKAAVARYKP